MGIKIDDKEVMDRFNQLAKQVEQRKRKSLNDVASEILRLSQREVPHDIGTLQNSGFVEDRDEEAIVGYNTVYAARLHEHPEYSFQKGRKGKYLEDPIKLNLETFREFFKNLIN